MKGLVLAAGRGSRLGEHTADRPKCLVEVDGRSLLDRQVAALRAAGVDEVGVVTGWCSDAFDGVGLPEFHNPDWASTSMVASLACAHDWLSAGPVLVSYGDIVFDAGTARRLAKTAAPLAIAYDPDWARLWGDRFTDPLDDAETFALDEHGTVTDIGGKPQDLSQVNGQYTGLVRWTPAAWQVVHDLRCADAEFAELDMTGVLRHVVRAGILPVRAVPVTGPWCEFDHPSDLVVGHDIIRALDTMAAGVAS